MILLDCGSGNGLKAAKLANLYGCKLVTCDLYSKSKAMLRSDAAWLPVKRADIITAIDVLEHLTKDDGYKFLRYAQQIAERIIIYTPRFWQINDTKKFSNALDQACYGDNPYNVHRSLWTVEELKELGFDTSESDAELIKAEWKK